MAKAEILVKLKPSKQDTFILHCGKVADMLKLDCTVEYRRSSNLFFRKRSHFIVSLAGETDKIDEFKDIMGIGQKDSYLPVILVGCLMGCYLSYGVLREFMG